MLVTVIHTLQQQQKNAYKNTPLTPNVGPWEGCRRQAKELSLRWAERAWTSPMVTVLFPSPRGVGVILKNIDQKHYQHMLSHIQWEKVVTLHLFILIPSSLFFFPLWSHYIRLLANPLPSILPLSLSLWSGFFGSAVKACQWLTVIE